ncbi:MAG: aminotransferase class IV [Mangrovicoccus sp.]|nr:aminotransferase class IV [Mangrovicoccus sp.]
MNAILGYSELMVEDHEDSLSPTVLADIRMVITECARFLAKADSFLTEGEERTTTPEVVFDLTDRGPTLGDGRFETAMVLAGRVVFGAAHLVRLAQCCWVLGMPFDIDLAAEAMAAVAADLDFGALRLTVTRGNGPRGVVPPAAPHPRLIASAAPADPAAAFAPLRLTETAIRCNDTSPLSRLKSLAYLDTVLATAGARAAGFDEALFLNTRGRVACAGTGNVFFLQGHNLLTPPLSEGVLDGIIRGWLLGHAAAAGLSIVEASVEPDALQSADAILVTSSLRLIAPVTHLGPLALPPLPPVVAALAARLRTAIAADCGVTPDLVPGFEGPAP